jgi:CBS domain-containing protein
MTLVLEAMNRALVTVRPDASMEDAVAVVRGSGAEHVLVMEEQTLVGILCACDLRGARSGDRVASCMSSPVVTVRPDARVEAAAAALVEHAVGCLPVAVGGLILGTVSGAELTRAGVAAPLPRCHHRHRRVPRTARH